MTAPDITFTDVVGHEFFLAFYGVVVYYAIIYKIWKHAHPKSPFVQFRKYALAGFLATLLISFAVIILDDETIYLIGLFTNKNIIFGDWVYMSSGVIMDFLTRVIIKLRS